MSMTRKGIRKGGHFNHIKDMTGQVFGFLTILEMDANVNPNGGTLWKCACACGKTVILPARELRRGHYRDCGCVTLPRRVKRTQMRILESVNDEGI